MLLTATTCLALLQAISHVSALSTRQSSDDDERDKFRRRGHQSVVQVGSYAYFEGGSIAELWAEDLPESERKEMRFSTLYSLDLSRSWSNSTVNFTTQGRGDPPPIRKSYLWPDNEDSCYYRWGGNDASLWKFASRGSGALGWDDLIPEGDPALDDIVSTIGGAAAQCGRKGYFISGKATKDTDRRITEEDAEMPVPGLITYDMDTKKWTNESTAALTDDLGGALMSGRALCAKSQEEESLVILLGGETTSATSAIPEGLRNMDNITFWDPESGRWHWQQANGAIPDRRRDFCAVSVQGGENTTEIFVYGGQGDEETYSDMHILTIPGFRWFKVDDFDSPPRVHHSCVPIGPVLEDEEDNGSRRRRQMLTTGGLLNDTKQAWGEDDLWPYTLGLFDMTDLEWKAEYDPEAETYETPKMIRDWYDDNGMDSVSWTSDSVESLFTKDNSSGDNTDSEDPESGSNPGSNSDSSSDSGSDTPVGAIAGGVVGGVAALALIAGLAWWYRRRQHKRRHTSELPATEVSPQPLKPEAGLGGGGGGLSPKPLISEADSRSPHSAVPKRDDSVSPAYVSSTGTSELPAEPSRLELPTDINTRSELPG